MKICLPDINIWVALSFEAHLHHEVALNWFSESAARQIGFCRTTQQGFLRLTTNSKAVGSDAFTLPEAWGAYDLITSDSRIIWIDEPRGMETTWRSLTGNATDSPKIWTDAYLAAFARAADLELVTLDRGFDRFMPLNLNCLLR